MGLSISLTSFRVGKIIHFLAPPICHVGIHQKNGVKKKKIDLMAWVEWKKVYLEDDKRAIWWWGAEID